MKKLYLTEKRKKIISASSIAMLAVLFALIFIYVGRPMLRFVTEPEKFRLWVDGHGVWGRLVFLGMVTLQVVVAVIPGEPLEICAGYAFGVLEGTLLCILGMTVGSALVFLFVRYFGVKAVEVFYPREKINSLSFLQNTKKLNMLVFIVFFIPGTPKDLLCYFVGLTKMKLSTWLIISATARIPSIITSTVGGNALGTEQYKFAAAVFAATIIISAVGIIIYRLMSGKS